MIEVKKALLGKDRYPIKCPYTMTPEFVVIHNTANDATAENEIAYMKRNNSEVSFHYAVDEKEAVQGIPENRNAWHAGDGGKGEGNRRGIAIEICRSKSGGKRFKAAEKNAAELTADILKRYGWGVDHIRTHRDFSGKNCPHRTLALGWTRFISMVQAALAGGEKEKPAPEYTVGKVYYLKADALSVRTGPGTEKRRKLYPELTDNARANAYRSGHLKKGTAVTCLEVRKSGENIWIRIPSGWCAAFYEGKEYIAA